MSAAPPIDPPMNDTPRSPVGDNLFADRDFQALWAVSIVHNLGEKLFFVFLISLGDMANHSNSLVSAISLAFSAPAILFGSMAGVVVDRFSLRTLMITSCALRAGLVLLLPLAGINVWSLLGFAFAFSFLTRFHDPAFMKAIPTLVPKHHLMAANSVFMTTMVAALIGSFAIAGPIWAWAGFRHAHLAVVALYVVGAVAATLIHLPPAQAKAETQGSFWEQWRFAFDYLRAHPRLMKAYVMTMTMFGTVAAINVIAKGFANTALGTTNPTDFTRILAFAGFGMVLGALALGRWGRHVPKPRLVRIGFRVSAVAMVALAILGMLAMAHHVALPTAWILTFALALGIGAGTAAIEIPVATLVQEGVAEEVRGRIFGVQAMLMNLASTLPMALAGPLADLWGPAVVMGLLGLQMGGMSLFRLQEAPPERSAA